MKKIMIATMVFAMMAFGIADSNANWQHKGKKGSNHENYHAFSYKNWGHYKKHSSRLDGHKFLRCLHKINLSDVTKEKVRTLMEDYKVAKKERYDMLKDAYKTYFDALMSEAFDEIILTSAENTIITLKEEILKSKFEFNRAIRDALTPEELSALLVCMKPKLDDDNYDDNDNDDDDDDDDNDDDDNDDDDDDN